MAMRIKISKMGGYVVGDGDCPFDPDQFMQAFGDKIITAQAKAQKYIDISDEEIQAAREEWHNVWGEAITTDTKGKNTLEKVATAIDTTVDTILPPLTNTERAANRCAIYEGRDE